MKHILVVDDHRPGSRLVCRMLRMSGFETHYCSTGEEAFDYLQDYHPSVGLVVTDWKMPGVDGLDVCQFAKQLDIPTVVLSAHSQEDCHIALPGGAADYLVKPVTRPILADTVQKYLS